MKQDLGIVNGKIYMNGNYIDANIYASNGKITGITTDELPCEKQVDAKGRLILPGFIDPHVHFHLGVGENINEDDFQEGSIKGLLGGITTYIDFLDPVKSPEQVENSFQKRMLLASKSYSDYAFHGTVANPKGSAKEMLEKHAEQGITSLKLFTTYGDTDRRTYDSYIRDLLLESSETKSKIVIHAENDDLITADNNTELKDHEKSRPSLCERTEVVKLAEMAKDTKGHLYIVHVSAGSTAKMVQEQYAKELADHTITLESCPHYFIFNSDIYKKENGYLYTMTPPLRPEEDRKLLVEYLDSIETIGTDHCPYPEWKKNKKRTSQIPMGIGGITYSFLNMYTLFGNRIIDKYTQNPAKAYGLYPKKGVLSPGSDADIVILNPNIETVIKDENSVYYNMKLQGNIEKVFLRGELVVENSKVYPSKGEYIRRQEYDK